MEPSGRIKHTGPPQSTTGRVLRPDAPVFTPQGHCHEPQFGPPQQMYQNPNQPPTMNVFSYSRAVKKQPENVNYQREPFQNIQQPVEPEGISSISNLPQPDRTNSTTSWHVASNPQQRERQDSQINDYQSGNFENNQTESVQPFEPENIRNMPQPNPTNSTAPWGVDNNVQPNERQNRQDFSSSDYKGNKTSQKSARVGESCNLYQEIDSRPQNYSTYQARGHRNRYNSGGQRHSRSRDNYQKENDQRRTSTNNFNKNTAYHGNSNNSAAEANTVPDSSWGDWNDKPIDSTEKIKTNSKWSEDSKREPHETRSGYGYGLNNRGHNYDLRRTSFNKNTADHDNLNNSAAGANTADSWGDDGEETPTESTRNIKPKDETSKWSKDFKRDPQKTRSASGNRYNNRGRRTSNNSSKYSADNNRDNPNNSVKDNDVQNNDKPTKNAPDDSQDDDVKDCTKRNKDFKREPQETRSGYENRGYKPRGNNYDPRRTSTNNSSKYSANRDNSNNSVEHQFTPESWEDTDTQSKDISPVIDSQDDDDDVKEPIKPQEECKAKNIDTIQCQEKLPKNVHQDKQATDPREETDENDSAWNGAVSSTPEKPEQTSKQREHQRNKPKDPRMEREKLNKSESSIFGDQSNIEKTVRRSDGNYRQMSSGVSDKDKEIWDKEFNKWDREWKRIKDFKIVNEITGDLFEQPKEYSLAHCVAEDLKMGSGIAVAFKREFKNVPDLLDQRAKQGGLALLPDEKNKRFVYYLVTKRESNGKPTYFTLWKSLCNMKEHIKQNGVKNLAIPRLACGLDRLEWDMVKSMIEFLFTDVDVKITVCNFQQNHGKTKKKLQTRASVDKGKSKKKS